MFANSSGCWKVISTWIWIDMFAVGFEIMLCWVDLFHYLLSNTPYTFIHILVIILIIIQKSKITADSIDSLKESWIISNTFGISVIGSVSSEMESRITFALVPGICSMQV